LSRETQESSAPKKATPAKEPEAATSKVPAAAQGGPGCKRSLSGRKVTVWHSRAQLPRATGGTIQLAPLLPRPNARASRSVRHLTHTALNF
jgi:hypothetical protein